MVVKKPSEKTKRLHVSEPEKSQILEQQQTQVKYEDKII